MMTTEYTLSPPMIDSLLQNIETGAYKAWSGGEVPDGYRIVYTMSGIVSRGVGE